MKNEVNRALVAKKKTYQIPSVEMALLMPSAIILAGSPGISGGGKTGDLGSGDPIGGD